MPIYGNIISNLNTRRARHSGTIWHLFFRTEEAEYGTHQTDRRRRKFYSAYSVVRLEPQADWKYSFNNSCIIRAVSFAADWRKRYHTSSNENALIYKQIGAWCSWWACLWTVSWMARRRELKWLWSDPTRLPPWPWHSSWSILNGSIMLQIFPK